MKWRKIKKSFKEKALVTNNIKAKDNNGQPSHVFFVDSFYKQERGFDGFKAGGWDRVYNLTHYIPLSAILKK